MLRRITEMKEHAFWPDDLSMTEAIGPDLPLVGHNQITDAYLLALVVSKDAIFATLDRAVPILAAAYPSRVQLIAT